MQNRSESIKELAAALAKAQASIEGAKKDKNNPAFRSKYADLSSVTEAVANIGQHGLAYVQVSHDRPDAAVIETIILHSSGEWMSSGIVAVPVGKHDAHGFGSALTYARRYSLSTAFGVAPEDDDGNAAAKAAPQVNGKGAGPVIAPASGYWEAMAIDVQNEMSDTAHRVSTLLKKKDVAGAVAELQAAVVDFAGKEDYMAAQWTRFESHERRALKEGGFSFSAQKEAA